MLMFEKSPDVQDKLKVAFAEGYMANSRRFVDSVQMWGSFMRKLIFWTILIWLGLQLVQNYGMIGGSE